MQLTRVLLERFRAIERLDLRIGPTCVLIGEETTGKPSIVDAIAAASGFGEEATSFAFEGDDFRESEDGEPLPIRVILDFRERIRRGEIVHENGQATGFPGSGRLLARARWSGLGPTALQGSSRG